MGKSCGLNGSILWPEWVSSVAPIGQSCSLSRSVGQSCGPFLLQGSDSFLEGFLIDCTVSWDRGGCGEGLALLSPWFG